jgi:SAM-dependent methyltransferase
MNDAVPLGDSAVITRLHTLAEVAVRHAAEFHRVRLGDAASAVIAVDRVLIAEREAVNRATLIACYGAWFGALLVRHLHGRWIGLHDAAPPRVALARAVVSPMDAVDRLLSDGVHTLTKAFAQAREWSVVAGDRAAVLATNAMHWNALATDSRFIGDEVPADREAAEALLDPWLLAEGVAGKRVLCLAAGGGRHGPLLARAGAQVSVLDLAPDMLAIDRRLADGNALQLTTVPGSIDDLPARFSAASFDVVIQPVCTSYVRDLAPVHAGLAHVLRPGGLLVAQHKQPASLQAHAVIGAGGWSLQSFSVDGLPLPPVDGHEHREDGMQEFLHPLDTLLGGLCRAGFVIEDLEEPQRGDAWAPAGSTAHRAAFLPPYLKLKARRSGDRT